MVTVRGTNDNIYSTIEKAVSPPKTIDYTKKIARKNKEQTERETEQKQKASLYVTNLRAARNAEVKEKYDSFVTGVENGSIKYKSQEWYRGIADFKQTVTEQAKGEADENRLQEAILKNPEKYNQSRINRRGADGKLEIPWLKENEVFTTDGSKALSEMIRASNDPNNSKIMNEVLKTTMESLSEKKEMTVTEELAKAKRIFEANAETGDSKKTGVFSGNVGIRTIKNLNETDRKALIYTMITGDESTYNKWNRAKAQDSTVGDYTTWAFNHWDKIIPKEEVDDKFRSIPQAPSDTGKPKWQPTHFTGEVFTPAGGFTEDFLVVKTIKDSDGKSREVVTSVKLEDMPKSVSDAVIKKRQANVPNELKSEAIKGYRYDIKSIPLADVDAKDKITLNNGSQAIPSKLIYNKNTGNYFVTYAEKFTASTNVSGKKSKKSDGEATNRNTVNASKSKSNTVWVNKTVKISEARIANWFNTQRNLTAEEVDFNMTVLNPNYNKQSSSPRQVDTPLESNKTPR